MQKHLYTSLYIVLLTFTIAGQQTPSKAQQEPITIEGAIAHLGNGEIIQNSLIMFAEGKITFIGDAKMKIARQGKIIEAAGKHVYPGFIIPSTTLGLVEVNSVRASDDRAELGDFIPHVRSLIAYNAESKVVESMRPNGVLIGQITPTGGRIAGTSSIVQFDAWNWEDAAIKVDDGIHLKWPNSFKQGRPYLGEEKGFQPSKEYQKQVTDVHDFIKNSAAYDSNSKEINPAFEAMKGLFDGSKKIYVSADSEKEIIDAITTLKSAGAKKIVLVGGYDAHKVIDFLKADEIPVLVRAPHNLPNFDDDDYDLPYKLPKLLSDAGLLVAIQNADASIFQTRNLPFYAGQLVGQGMDKEKALQTITFNTAKILGIDEDYGTLEVGKSATLFISEGDALDMRGNQLTNAFIDGRSISLETHQTVLWKRYMEKFNSN